ncbi:MAG TPA: cobyrinate a,c-diamide synthase [Methylophilaceae bacterium]|nr:cobyrinate a,c-diamide synthase [Methylophilaceae bacterium]HQC29184.1 cobyrinate a,c-diamide synthase [Methylotenera sp.]
MTACRAVLVSAPASGQGKTLVTAALARAWRKQGLRVQAFKCGPDFLDPMILELATGHPVYQLDFTMCGETDCQVQLYKAAQQADLIIIEGVMGLYDGTPSSADIATRFDVPVLITIDAGGMAQTFGAVASGLLNFNPKLKSAGTFANKVGSQGHADLLRSSLPTGITWFGALQKNPQFALPERHLGLFRACEIDNLDDIIEAAANALMTDLPLPPMVSFSQPVKQIYPQLLASKTIAIAKDDAFCFIYQANLDWLIEMGATLTYFSPLHDTALPEADAYWLPGGYPELHLSEISTNTAMKNALQQAAIAHKPILAECGGMMALSASINGKPAFNVLPGNSQIHDKLQGLGAIKVTLADGEIGSHTFHYGSFATPLTPSYMAKTRFGKTENIYQHGSITASFLHFYFASNPQVAARLFLS